MSTVFDPKWANPPVVGETREDAQIGLSVTCMAIASLWTIAGDAACHLYLLQQVQFGQTTWHVACCDYADKDGQNGWSWHNTFKFDNLDKAKKRFIANF